MPRAPGNVWNCPQAALYQAVPRQPYQSEKSQHVYQYVEKKMVCQVDNKPSEKLEENLPNSKTYYINKPYNKL